MRFHTHFYEDNVTVSMCCIEPMFCLFSQIVKFSQPGQDRVSLVSDVDLGIYQLQRSERLLEVRVEALGLEAEK